MYFAGLGTCAVCFLSTFHFFESCMSKHDVPVNFPATRPDPQITYVCAPPLFILSISRVIICLHTHMHSSTPIYTLNMLIIVAYIWLNNVTMSFEQFFFNHFWVKEYTYVIKITYLTDYSGEQGVPLALQRTISRHLTPSTSLERNVQRHVTLSSFQPYE